MKYQCSSINVTVNNLIDKVSRKRKERHLFECYVFEPKMFKVSVGVRTLVFEGRVLGS